MLSPVGFRGRPLIKYQETSGVWSLFNNPPATIDTLSTAPVASQNILFGRGDNNVTFTLEGPRWAGIAGYLDQLKIYHPDVEIVYSERKGFLRSSCAIRMSSESLHSLRDAVAQMKTDLENHTGERIPVLDDLLRQIRENL